MGGSELRYGSLFSGIGGIDLGMDLAGFECAWQVEVDDYCRQVLETHWPGVPKYKDIYDVKGSELEPVDIRCGGVPGQPVSVAGKRSGVDDERWLWDEFYRLICEVRPRWVVAENVPGLLSANSGRAFAGVLRDLAEGGYDVVWDVFPAGGPGGVGALHRRERIFIIGKLADSNSKRQQEQRKSESVQKDRQEPEYRGGDAGDVADTDSTHSKRGRISRRAHTKNTDINGKSSSKDVANTKRIGQQGQGASRKWGRSETYGERQTDNAFTIGIENQWGVEPDVGRVANGVPNRVDRLKALGNAVVPQVAYKVARMISEYTEKEK